MAVSNSPSKPSRQPHARRATAATARSRPRGGILPGRRSVSAAKAPDDLDSRRNGRAGTVTVSDDLTGRRCVIAEIGDLEAVPGSVRTGPCSPTEIGTLRARTASGRRAGKRAASGNPPKARPRHAGKRFGRPRPIFSCQRPDAASRPQPVRPADPAIAGAEPERARTSAGQGRPDVPAQRHAAQSPCRRCRAARDGGAPPLRIGRTVTAHRSIVAASAEGFVMGGIPPQSWRNVQTAIAPPQRFPDSLPGGARFPDSPPGAKGTAPNHLSAHPPSPDPPGLRKTELPWETTAEMQRPPTASSALQQRKAESLPARLRRPFFPANLQNRGKECAWGGIPRLRRFRRAGVTDGRDSFAQGRWKQPIATGAFFTTLLREMPMPLRQR